MKKEQITLRDWLRTTGASSWNKYLDKWLDLKVVEEHSSISTVDSRDEDAAYLADKHWDQYLQKLWGFTSKHTYSFIVLENGYAVGWNESPSHGWTFPRSPKKRKL